MLGIWHHADTILPLSSNLTEGNVPRFKKIGPLSAGTYTPKLVEAPTLLDN